LQKNNPVSIVGLAASVATIADLALVVFVNLNSFYQKVRDAPKKSKELRERLDSPLDQLADIQDALEKNQATNGSELPLQDLEGIKSWLKCLQEKTARQSPHGIIRRLKWPFTEQENDRMINDIEWVKGSLDTRLGTEQLYTTQTIPSATLMLFRRGIGRIESQVGEIRDVVVRNDQGGLGKRSLLTVCQVKG
jgi:hypothetical protein